jgi:hypothetical protein
VFNYICGVIPLRSSSFESSEEPESAVESDPDPDDFSLDPDPDEFSPSRLMTTPSEDGSGNS